VNQIIAGTLRRPSRRRRRVNHRLTVEPP
jgi:hypothetical protein